MRRRSAAWRIVVVGVLAVAAGIAAGQNWPDGMPAEVIGGLLLLALTVLGGSGCGLPRCSTARS